MAERKIYATLRATMVFYSAVGAGDAERAVEYARDEREIVIQKLD
jgi:hypothetical protein